ncbi:MAG: hypothetical protein P1U61_06545 [Legionellaceae bacterium]|nr:hypothetical protein [Legionellaceae bacterium]
MSAYEHLRTLNRIKNTTVYAPLDLTYSTFFKPAEENILLAALGAERVDIGLNQKGPFVSTTYPKRNKPSNLVGKCVIPGHISLFRRPSFDSAFMSLNDMLNHIKTPILMAIVAGVQAAQSLLNTLLYLPYNMIAGSANIMVGNIDKSFAYFQQAGFNVLHTLFWVFSAFIDPCLELVSCITRAAATCIYGISTTENEQQKAIASMKDMMVKNLKSFLENNPFILSLFKAKVDELKATTAGLRFAVTMAQSHPETQQVINQGIHTINAQLNACCEQTKALQDFLKNGQFMDEILRPLLARNSELILPIIQEAAKSMIEGAGNGFNATPAPLQNALLALQGDGLNTDTVIEHLKTLVNIIPEDIKTASVDNIQSTIAYADVLISISKSCLNSVPDLISSTGNILEGTSDILSQLDDATRITASL